MSELRGGTHTDAGPRIPSSFTAHGVQVPYEYRSTTVRFVGSQQSELSSAEARKKSEGHNDERRFGMPRHHKAYCKLLQAARILM